MKLSKIYRNNKSTGARIPKAKTKKLIIEFLIMILDLADDIKSTRRMALNP